jgi:hypothetical protein
LVEAVGSARNTMARLEITGGLVVVERGSDPIQEPLSLATLLSRRPAPTWSRRVSTTASRVWRRARRSWSKAR